MGTDFNYLYSEEMRRIMDENCMESYKGYLHMDEYVDPFQNSDWASFLPDNRNVNDA